MSPILRIDLIARGVQQPDPLAALAGLLPPWTPPRLRNVFGRRRPTSRASAVVLEAFARYGRSVEQVEAAKASLAAAAPGGRGQGVSLAQALAEFDWGLVEAGRALPSWRTPEVEEVWQACSDALGESSRRAEALRLGEHPRGYEQLYTMLQDLMEPLEVFAAALDRFRELGA